MKRIFFFLMMVMLLAGCSKGVKYPVIYLDMDGTLLDEDHHIRQASLDAIEEYKACGGKVGIATGRNALQLLPDLHMIRPTMPVVMYNGAVTAVYDSKKGAVDIIGSSTLPEEIFREIVTKARTIPEVGTLVMEALGKRVIDKADAASLAYFKKVGIVWESTDAALPYDKEDPPVKVLMYVKNGKAPDVTDKLKTMLGDKVVVKQGNPFVIDITPAGQTKATAIAAIVKSLGYKMDRNVMAFGDSGNDKEMLAEAALGMAMANCKPETCESAKMIIGPNTTDSIAKAIRALAISESCGKK